MHTSIGFQMVPISWYTQNYSHKTASFHIHVVTEKTCIIDRMSSPIVLLFGSNL